MNASAPDGAIVVLGGLDWGAIHEKIAAKSAAEPRRGLFASLNVPTPWSVYVDTLEPPVRERIERVNRACENAGLLRDPPCGSWNHDHHFVCTDGTALCFSWRAWGDLMVAITGEGDYMDYYA